ncbi:MAG: helix-turn-helix domain-containing protein [Rickettsiales bacterium]|nr:helix-turn-helix domain-containing protein [Rickettsiales bacterium]
MKNYNPKQVGKRLKSFREGLSKSQEEVAVYLKIPRPSVSQIENGNRLLSAIELAKLSELFLVPVDQILFGIDEDKKKALVPRIAGKAVKKLAAKFNEKKFREILLYVLSKTAGKANVGETVLYKLLYFCDFNYYEKYRDHMTGATYIKNHFGPTPTNFKKVIESLRGKEVEMVKGKFGGFEQTKYMPLREADLRQINGAEKQVIDEVIDRLSSMNAKQISQYSHDDTPWIATKDGEVIDYQLVFYRSPAYSVGEYDEL